MRKRTVTGVVLAAAVAAAGLATAPGAVAGPAERLETTVIDVSCAWATVEGGFVYLFASAVSPEGVAGAGMFVESPDGEIILDQIGKQRSQGVEANVALGTWTGFALRADVGLTLAKYLEFNQNVGSGFVSRTGNTPPGVPVLIWNLTPSQRAQIRNREIGFIFQAFNLIGDLTVYENVELPLTYRSMPSSERKKRVEEALERVRLDLLRHEHLRHAPHLDQRLAAAVARTHSVVHERTRSSGLVHVSLALSG
jgi:energy-coupling factor transporter ATP-binding protein EcfA2